MAKEKAATERFKTNPFLSDLVISKRSKQVRISSFGSNSDIKVVNQETGEVHGTHVVTHKRVDADEFVKLFTSNIGFTFDLTSAGVKTLGVLLWLVQHTAINRDVVRLDQYAFEDWCERHEKESKKLSLPTFRRGLAELTKSKIIAKSVRKGDYFINPSFVFNGDRIAFTTLIERSQSDENLQQNLPI